MFNKKKGEEVITTVKADRGTIQLTLSGTGMIEANEQYEVMALVNGEILEAPFEEGDVVSVRERSKSLEIIVDSLASRATRYSWLEWDEANMSGKFLNYPQRADIPENIKEQLIVELYSK